MLKKLSKSILYIADFFAVDILGGAEMNDDTLILRLRESGQDVYMLRCREVDVEDAARHGDRPILLSNFTMLRQNVLEKIMELGNYSIIEHDHKYLTTRDPAQFEGFRAPESAIINRKLYEGARAVFCMSNLHESIMRDNLGSNVDLVNLHGSLWTDEDLNLLEGVYHRRSGGYTAWTVAVLDSPVQHKGTWAAVKYCEANSLQAYLLPQMPKADLYKKLADIGTFLFMPQTPETLSRVVVEARALGCKLILSGAIGAKSEPWINLKGDAMVEKMREMQITIPDKVLKHIL